MQRKTPTHALGELMLWGDTLESKERPQVYALGEVMLCGSSPRAHRKTLSRLLGGDALGGIGLVCPLRVQKKDLEPTRGS